MDCFRTTEWKLLQKAHGEGIDGFTQCVTDYCTSGSVMSVVPTKKFCCFSSNIPWIYRDINAYLAWKGQKEQLTTSG